jgi:hypothetical protein
MPLGYTQMPLKEMHTGFIRLEMKTKAKQKTLCDHIIQQITCYNMINFPVFVIQSIPTSSADVFLHAQVPITAVPALHGRTLAGDMTS